MFIKLFSLQVFASAKYRKASIDNSVRIVPIKAPRGEIIDRNNNIIVQNRPSYTIYLVPYEVPNIDEESAILASMLQMDESYLKKIISAGWKGKFQPIRLKRDVDFKTISILEEHSLDVPGVVFRVEPTRLYPENGFGSHVYGYVGEVSENEIEANNKYSKGEIIGKKGLERFYNYYLKGFDGISYLEVTARGRVLGKYSEREDISPQKGATLQLNIDWQMQKLAESILAAKGQGSIVVLNVNNGGVLALASSPKFDANLFSGVVPTEKWAEIMADSTYPLLNRAIQGIYTPGSTFKPFTALMALHFDKVDMEKEFDPCRGQKKFGNRIFKCWLERGHGKLELHDAIVQSCNIYFYQLGLACGMELWDQFMPLCRLGELTGIDIPGEKAGICPTSAYFDKRYGVRGWTKYFMNNLAIGQGEILVTPLQMAVLYAAISNEGIIYKPRILNKIITYEGDTIICKPEIVGKLPVNKENFQIIVDALHGVASEQHGTARFVSLPGIPVAGKTGTAQNPHGNEHAWFVCFAPVENPEIVIAVIVENAGHGSSEAAPLAKKILKYYFLGENIKQASL
ncbi:MAG: penicillin-binding protein 2 [candidate division Zixibacteria bacterium]|nr:penicillin-binding protein 2 [candidate division Zixibacteria bacterium]